MFNSYPRSGSTYLRHVFSQVFGITSESIHIPEVLSLTSIDQISVFRKPEESIASFIMMRYPVSTNPVFDINSIPLSDYLELYKKYMFYAEKNKESIFIVKFDNIINNEMLYFEYISKNFFIPFVNQYEVNFKSMNFSGKSWTDLYSGAYPRYKNEVRINIENKLKNMDLIKKLNQNYEDFIKTNETQVLIDNDRSNKKTRRDES